MLRNRLLLSLFCLLVYVYLLAPIFVVVGASFNDGAFLTFPPHGLSLRWFAAFLDNAVFMDAIVRSLWLALAATVISCVIGVAAALYHVRHAVRTREALRIAVLLPLLLPEVLTAMALLFFFHTIGLGARFGIGMLIGHVLITLPFVFLNVVTALHGVDLNCELAARSLGARPWTRFRRVTLPLIKPGVINGCLFAFIISFDTFGISYLLKDVGSATLPLQLFDYLRFNFTPEAAAVSTMSIGMAVLAVVATEKLVGLKVERY
ncbi:ABC transporter permease [Aquabacterium sp.]|uniref:ABC transporter permease n=1 Tax=Aquabacterium sp. TaxID=1872578 RepID=UPI002BD5FA84|nr:ABC transporter permease [Aquabacterium sp.]HSW08382.1 ABC transporter permease [Aquabacterium sp.]